jgi:hypothetical protein
MRLFSVVGWLQFPSSPKTSIYENILINRSKRKRLKIVEIAQINRLSKHSYALRKFKCSALAYASGKQWYSQCLIISVPMSHVAEVQSLTVLVSLRDTCTKAHIWDF